MVGDLFDVLQFYFDENGNQAEDLIMLGYSEYFGALGLIFMIVSNVIVSCGLLLKSFSNVGDVATICN